MLQGMDVVERKRAAGEDPFFLPDFCTLPTVFGVAVLAQLFAFIVALAGGLQRDFWQELALVSLFMQWAGLSCAAALCLLRRPLRRLPDTVAAAAAYGTILLVVALLSEVTVQTTTWAGLTLALEHGPFLARNLGVGAIVGALALRYFHVRHQWRRQIEAESEARLQALQAYIRPHFLFNSMNTIASLTHSDPAAAEAAVEDLSDLLRASLGAGDVPVTLAEELALTRRYLHMEGLRLGERLRVQWDLPEPLPVVRLPSLTLQPLVENALYHGIEPLPEGGTLTIAGRVQGRQLTLTLRNPLPPADRHHRQGNRRAMENIRLRLAAHFAGGAKLEAEEGELEYRLTLTLPCEEGR